MNRSNQTTEQNAGLEPDKAAEQVTAHLTDYAQQLPDDITTRLGQARRAAVSDRAQERTSKSWLPQLAMGATFATLAVAIVLIAPWQQPEQSTAPTDFAQLEAVIQTEDFDLLASELEFYDWVETETENI
jgi:hypothetical protein